MIVLATVIVTGVAIGIKFREKIRAFAKLKMEQRKLKKQKATVLEESPSAIMSNNLADTSTLMA